MPADRSHLRKQLAVARQHCRHGRLIACGRSSKQLDRERMVFMQPCLMQGVERRLPDRGKSGHSWLLTERTVKNALFFLLFFSENLQKIAQWIECTRDLVLVRNYAAKN